jgi:hypothetical protein
VIDDPRVLEEPMLPTAVEIVEGFSIAEVLYVEDQGIETMIAVMGEDRGADGE